MAEFDSGGLSAVSAFFGVSDDKTDTTRTKHLDNVSRGRHGVGSTARKRETNSSKEESIGRVLNIGKRKRKEKQADDEDSDAFDEQTEHELDEKGRTAIAQDKTPNEQSNPVELIKQIKKKKKKKGKKQRQAEQAASKPTSAKDDAPDKEPEDKLLQAKEDAGEETQKPKQKRRKIRSRQKNIYKDKRLTQHKPSHLIPGRAEFQGRPMTAETRAKLHLAPSKSSRNHHVDETGEAEHVETMDQSSSGGGVKLAIDDLLDDQGEKQPGEVIAEKSQHKKKKKRKKSKYKNLQ